jgi:hypothetical protein
VKSEEQLKDENRNSKFETRRDFRVSIFDFRFLLARHSPLVTALLNSARSQCKILTVEGWLAAKRA